ncbi:hypothetical protein ABH908_000148 [Pseudomonas frederiksbergensis]
MKSMTVVRFPNGSWSTGGRPSDPDYEQCEVYVVPCNGEADAKKKAQAVRRRLVTKGLTLPSSTAPYRHTETVA